MTLEFSLLFGQLNLDSLSPEKQEEVVTKTGLNVTETVEVFGYRKHNERYWDGGKIHI